MTGGAIHPTRNEVTPERGAPTGVAPTPTATPFPHACGGCPADAERDVCLRPAGKRESANGEQHAARGLKVESGKVVVHYIARWTLNVEVE